jgi:indole-3-glycerol phosphate synthase
MLDQILDQKRKELPGLRRQRLPAPPPVRPLALRRSTGTPLRLIAEIKPRSPSAGALSSALGIADRARAYERAGANMISVLCDAEYFGGAYAHLALARQATALPLLCKDFVIDEVQLDHARAHGADAVLLIARCVSAQRLRELMLAARERELAVLLEVYLPEEVPVALEAGAELIGVNARDLQTLAMDAARARAILGALPQGVVRIHLSGIQKEAQIAELARSNVDAALIGECLMREDDPTDLLRRLVGATASA